MRKAEFVHHGDGTAIATLAQAGGPPTVVFLGGFRSDMRATKASALRELCRRRGCACRCFDYRGHGESGGDFGDATIGQWIEDALAVIDAEPGERLVLVGSSMGAWLMLHVALARPDRVCALIGVAAAPDMTERLLWQTFSPQQRHRLEADGVVYLPSAYDDRPYPITRQLIEEGRRHLLLHREVPVQVPVRLLHGLADRDVPWEMSHALLTRVATRDARLLLVKGADHRFSDPAHLRVLLDAVEEFLQ